MDKGFSGYTSCTYYVPLLSILFGMAIMASRYLILYFLVMFKMQE